MTKLIAVNAEGCTGCRTCELVCSIVHYGESNPSRAAIRVVRREKRGLAFSLPLVCQQCEKAACLEACPTGAISQDPERGTLAIDHGMCVGCGDCLGACPAGCIFMDEENGIALACDLCGGEPQCVAFCHARCLNLIDRIPGSEAHSVERLADILGTDPFAAAQEKRSH